MQSLEFAINNQKLLFSLYREPVSTVVTQPIKTDQKKKKSDRFISDLEEKLILSGHKPLSGSRQNK